MGKRSWTALWILALLASSIACNGEQPQPQAVGESVGTLLLESDAFAAEETIPQLYTCDGDDVSPPPQVVGATSRNAEPGSYL
jgi:phosphatidylethanolamine-binding protein (PEBP) family uncharacterized protein